MQQLFCYCGCGLIFLANVQPMFGSALTNGPNGINVPSGLTGAGIDLGQVEPARPGDPSFDTMGALFHSAVDPAGVFYRQPGPPMTFTATMNDAMEIGDGHATTTTVLTFTARIGRTEDQRAFQCALRFHRDAPTPSRGYLVKGG
jgi:hypothetical protein